MFGLFLKQDDQSRVTDPRWLRQSGMTLIEVMVVVGLIAFIYAIALPQFSLKTGTEAATKVQRLADSIRNAFDMAVLNQKTYRLVVEFGSGKYYLQEASSDFFIDSEPVDKDLTEEEETARREEFDSKTKEYESMAGDPIKDEEGNDIDGSNLSPILRNRGRAAPMKWETVEGMEWVNLSLGDFLMVTEIQAEHHSQKQLLSDLLPNGRAFIYFYPEGYVEKAYIRVAYKLDDFTPDESQKPYTIVTRPFLGTAEVNAGIVEVDVQSLEGDDDEG
jgi:general secretion pathway protein H